MTAPELHHEIPPYPPAWRRLIRVHTTDPDWPRPDAERWPWLIPVWSDPVGSFTRYIQAGGE